MRFSLAKRHSELAELDRFSRALASGSAAKLCIVSEPTGVGKSRLVDEAVAAAGLDQAFTRVRIALGEVQIGGETGFFLRASATAVSLGIKKRGGATLEDFARSRGSPRRLRCQREEAGEADPRGHEAAGDMLPSVA